jgi:hypothetical protein
MWHVARDAMATRWQRIHHRKHDIDIHTDSRVAIVLEKVHGVITRRDGNSYKAAFQINLRIILDLVLQDLETSSLNRNLLIALQWRFNA